MRRPSGVSIRPNSTVVPVKAGEVHQRLGADAMRLNAAAAVGLHVIGEHWIEQERHVTEQIVEQIRFGNVVELFGLADPPRDREAPVGQVIEEHLIGQQTFDADDFPAGARLQHCIQIIELRDRAGAHAEARLIAEEFAAGAVFQNLALAAEQRRPHLVVGARIARPRLFDDAGGVHRDIAPVGLLVFDTARLGVHSDKS